VTLGDQQAEHSPGPHHAGQGRQRGGRVVDDLEDAVAQDDVGAVGPDDVEQAGQVALPAGDRDVVLASPAVECGQGVGAGIDHGDPVTERTDPDREATGASTDVEDVARPVLHDGLEPGPDHGAAGTAAAGLFARHVPTLAGHDGGVPGVGRQVERACEVGSARRDQAPSDRGVERVWWFIRGSRGCGARACGQPP